MSTPVSSLAKESFHSSNKMYKGKFKMQMIGWILSSDNEKLVKFLTRKEKSENLQEVENSNSSFHLRKQQTSLIITMMND